MREPLLFRLMRRVGVLGVGTWLLVLFVFLAVFADLLASDLPIAMRFKGELYILPSVTRPQALADYDNQRLNREPEAVDWAWMPLCEYGPYQHGEMNTPPPAPPNGEHWLGTDDRGRDVFARLIHGSRTSLTVAGASVAVCLLLGVLLGLLAGFGGRWADAFVARLIEVGMTFPAFFLILTLMALLGGGSIWAIIWVVGLTRWTHIARLVRAEVLRIRALDFVAAARVSGASGSRILFRHILPNALGPVLVNAAFALAGVVFIEAGLSFLGFGAPAPTASWGEILSQAHDNPGAWWLILAPGLMIFGLVSGANLCAAKLSAFLDIRRRE
jgi:peptide/nickel transport system permease protein